MEGSRKRPRWWIGGGWGKREERGSTMERPERRIGTREMVEGERWIVG